MNAPGRPAPAPARQFALALCNEVVRELSFDAQCALAAGLGYDALEVAPFTLAGDPCELSERHLARLRCTAEDAGVRVSGLHWLLTAPAGLSITRAEPTVRERTLSVIHALIDVCAALGGITYVIEPLSYHETRFVTHWAEAADIVREVGSPALRTMIDTRAAGWSENEPVERVLERGLVDGTVAHVHVNDRDRRAPGQGEDRFAPVLDVLLQQGYDGTVGIEPFVYEPDGPTAAARAAGYVQGLIEALAWRDATRPPAG